MAKLSRSQRNQCTRKYCRDMMGGTRGLVRVEGGLEKMEEEVDQNISYTCIKLSKHEVMKIKKFPNLQILLYCFA